jgi:hypothetical protein
MAEVFRTLKELSLKKGSGPESVSASYRMFMETGTLGKPKEGARKMLGLDPLPPTGGDAVQRLMECDATIATCDTEGESQ